MKNFVIVAAALALGIVAVSAQEDPIAARRALMKSAGAQAGYSAKVIKGEEPFDLAKAKTVFATYADVAAKAAPLFPENSKTGGDTVAAPKIWETMDDFKAKLAKFGADAKAAGDSVKDLDSFKMAAANIGKDCGGCHETYRLRRN